MNIDSFVYDPSMELLPPERLNGIQTAFLRKHLAYCSEHSPYYRTHLPRRDWSGFSLKDLPSLPFTDKQDLAADPSKFQAVPWSEVSDVVFSSGTTGNPCRIVYSRSDMERLAYNEQCCFAAAGMTPEDRVLLTCTLDRCFVAGMAYYLGACRLGASAIRNGLNTMESHAEVIRSLAPTMVVGVPSFLRHLGAHLKEQGVPTESVRALICIGEPVHDMEFGFSELGKQLRALWNARVHSTYASSEIVTSFCDCTECRGGHLRADLAILEIVDDAGNPLPPGEVGEVVVTPLRTTGMPLIRFRTGDISFRTEEPCRCGRFTPRIGPILGRRAQMLKIRGTTLYPQALFRVLDASPEIIDYYLVATGRGLSDHVEVFAALRNPGSPVDMIEERLMSHCRLRFPVREISASEARGKIFGVSRKPVRFFDRRETVIPGFGTGGQNAEQPV